MNGNIRAESLIQRKLSRVLCAREKRCSRSCCVRVCEYMQMMEGKKRLALVQTVQETIRNVIPAIAPHTRTHASDITLHATIHVIGITIHRAHLPPCSCRGKDSIIASTKDTFSDSDSWPPSPLSCRNFSERYADTNLS